MSHAQLEVLNLSVAIAAVQIQMTTGVSHDSVFTEEPITMLTLHTSTVDHGRALNALIQADVSNIQVKIGQHLDRLTRVPPHPPVQSHHPCGSSQLTYNDRKLCLVDAAPLLGRLLTRLQVQKAGFIPSTGTRCTFCAL